jgi:PAS domain S-box-containing protein
VGARGEQSSWATWPTAVFVELENNRQESAGSRMAEMDRCFSRSLVLIGALCEEVRQIQSTRFDAETARAHRFGNFEFALAGVVCLILCVVTWYGHKMADFMRRGEEEQTKMTRFLEEREVRLQTIFQTASEGVMTINAQGVVESFNEAAAKIFGYPADEVIGQNISMLMPLPFAEQDDGYLANYLRRGEKKIIGNGGEVERNMKRKDGTLFPSALAVSEVNVDGTHLFTGIVRDLTESKRTEGALRESHEYVKNIIDSMIVVAPDGSIVTVNDATCTLLGYREEELIGQPVRLLFSEEEDLAKMIVSRKALPVKGRILGTLISVGHMSDVEGWYATKDGSKIPVNFSGSVRLDGEGEIQGIVCVAQDSTQQKQLQCELAQAQKLESVGQLAAGIAHEINTPTQYVGDNTRFLKDGFGDLCTVLDGFEKLLQAAKDGTVDEQLVAEVAAACKQADVEYLREEISQAIDQSLHGVERVAEIVRAMKEFSHPGGEGKSVVNLTDAIETTITVARNEWKYVAEMVTEFDPELPPVSCLPSELNQVFLNLIVNAAQAIGDALGEEATEKGMITVGTRRDGDGAEIFVQDTGPGIPEDVRARIFDPFFTTKEVGKGTGQGLAIARSVVVDKHGGTLDCETEQGKGTTFIVRLPIDGERQTQGGSEYEDACSIR